MDSAFAPYTWRQNNNAAAKQIFLITLLFDLGVGKDSASESHENLFSNGRVQPILCKDSTFFWYFDKNIVPMRCHRVPIRCHLICSSFTTGHSIAPLLLPFGNYRVSFPFSWRKRGMLQLFL
ncbi:hypothetical protein [Hallella sp.]|uniref:hypothetical protein n=1 Tax=Hallella sp. TaxID=2980186 RepID=UPI003079CA39